MEHVRLEDGEEGHELLPSTPKWKVFAKIAGLVVAIVVLVGLLVMLVNKIREVHLNASVGPARESIISRTGEVERQDVENLQAQIDQLSFKIGDLRDEIKDFTTALKDLKKAVEAKVPTPASPPPAAGKRTEIERQVESLTDKVANFESIVLGFNNQLVELKTRVNSTSSAPASK